MPKSWYENILKVGVIFSLVSFFIISRSMYFPYITGKQIYFNILIEVLTVLWLALIVKFPEIKPKKSFITWGLLAFFSALLISTIFSVDFNMSFWGDAERMLGWFPIVHLLALYFITITVFRTKRDWSWLLSSSLVAAVGLSVYAIVTNQGAKSSGNVNMTSNISTLGNATYVAGVMIFNFFFAWYLFFQTRSKILRGLILTAVLFILYAFFYADVSGSQAGWVLGVIVTLGLAGVLHENKQVRKWTWGGLAVLLVAIVLLFTFRSAPVFDNNKVGKILRDFNSNNVSFRARTYAWRAAVIGFKDYPIVGNGYGNFADHFDRYFKAPFYQWTINEEYYDRAHNNILDILSTGGLLSLLAYLSIFVALAYYLIKGYRQRKISVLEISIMMGIFISYFVHNLAVFDALANYILLFFSISFVYYLYNREEESETKITVSKKRGEDDWDEGEIWTLLVAGLVAVLIIYNYNYQVAQVFTKSVKAASYWQSTNDPLGAVKKYKEAFDINSPYDRDPRMLLANNINADPNRLVRLSAVDKQATLDYAISLVKKNIDLNPNDSLALLSLARLDITAYRLTNSGQYLKNALADIDASIANGGEHIPPYILKANILLMMGEVEQAKDALYKAQSFYPAYPDVYCHLAKIDFITEKISSTTYDLADQCLASERGQQAMGTGAFLIKLVEHYQSEKNWPLLTKVYELQLSQDNQNKELWKKLYELYKLTGQKEKADAVLEVIKEAIKR